MDILTTLQSEVQITDEEKKKYPVGIFGSFDKRNKIFLNSLKKFLADQGYEPRISEDLEKQFPQQKGEEKYQYSRRLSELLIANSAIHILFFFFEIEGEHNINQSASMEIEILKQQDLRNVVISHERRAFEQCKSVFKGLKSGSKSKSKAIDQWIWIGPFKRFNHSEKESYDDDDIESSAMQASLDIIRDLIPKKHW